MSSNNFISHLSEHTWNTVVYTEEQEEPWAGPKICMHVRWHQSMHCLGCWIRGSAGASRFTSTWTEENLSGIMSTIQNYSWPVPIPHWDFTPRQIPYNFRMNSLQLYQPFAWTNAYAFHFSFVLHTVSLWSLLHPEQVAGSYSQFKHHITVMYLFLYCCYIHSCSFTL